MSTQKQNPDIARALNAAKKASYGEFPDGRVSPDDEGATPMAVSSEPGIVKIQFATQVRWIGLTPEGAVELAAALIHYAKRAHS